MSTMGRRIRFGLAAAACAAAVWAGAGLAQAEAKGAGKAPAAARKTGPKVSYVIGVVSSLDAEAGKLVLKNRKGRKSVFSLVPEVQVVVNGKKTASLSDLAVGDRVAVRSEGRKEGATVTSITLLSPDKPKEDKKK